MTPEEQKAFFYDQGYLVVEGVVSPDELAECEEEIHNLHVMAADLAANGDKRSGSFSARALCEGQRARWLARVAKNRADA